MTELCVATWLSLGIVGVAKIDCEFKKRNVPVNVLDIFLAFIGVIAGPITLASYYFYSLNKDV